MSDKNPKHPLKKKKAASTNNLADHAAVKAAKEAPFPYTHLRAHGTRHDLVCRLLLAKKN